MPTKYFKTSKQANDYILKASREVDALFLAHNQRMLNITNDHIEKNHTGLSGKYLTGLIFLLKDEYKTFYDDLDEWGGKHIPYVGKSSHALTVDHIDGAKIDTRFRNGRINEYQEEWRDEIQANMQVMAASDFNHLRATSRAIYRQANVEGETRSSATSALLIGALAYPSFKTINKNGTNWSSKTNLNMLARTRLGNTNRRMTYDTMAKNKEEFGLVDFSARPCPNCQQFEGRILSLTGGTSGITTVDEAEGAGLFHPNCQHSITPISRESVLGTYDPAGRPKSGYNSVDDPHPATKEAWSKYKKAHRGKNGKWLKNAK